MNATNCRETLDRLPELAGGRLGPDTAASVRGHLEGCADCRAEWEVVSLLVEAGPVSVPAGLDERVRGALRRQAPAPTRRGADAAPPSRPGRWRVPSWGLAAAAGLVLAVATPVLVERMGEPAAPVVDDAALAEALTDELPSPWIDDGATVAGAPILDGLSDEALEQLLEEMGG